MSKQQIKALIQGQQWAEAKSLCARFCKANKGDPEAWFLLGAINGQLGAFDEAETCSRQVIAIRPDVPLAHYNLGIALHRQGKADAAIRSFREAIRLKPDFADAYNELGVALQSIGRLDEALVHYRKALALRPAYPEAHYNVGVVLNLLGRPEEATAAFQQTVKLRPDHAEAHGQLGALFANLKRYDEAISHYRRAVAIRPDHVEMLNDLACVLLNRTASIEDFEEAEKCYRQALQYRDDMPAIYMNLSVLLRDTGRIEEAMIFLQRAHELSPHNPDVMASMALAHEYKGDFEAGHALIKPFLDSGEENPNVALAYAKLARHLDQRAEAVAMLERVKEPGILARGIHFHAGKLYDELKEYDKAFAHFQQAHALATGSHDVRLNKQRFDDLISVFSRENLERWPRASNRSRLPVFIVGMPRSGTTLVEQILASHPEVYGAGELAEVHHMTYKLPEIVGKGIPYPQCVAELGQEKLDALAQRHLERLREFSPTATYVTDKMPHNFMSMGLLDMLFPETRIIHCMRDPIDTCLSIYFLPFNSNSHAYSERLEHLGDYYRQYLRLMAHWRKVLRVPMLEVQYEDLVANQEAVSRRMVEFCGLEWDERCLRFHEAKRSVATHSYDQVRRPLYKKSVARWKRYERHLGPLIAALGDAVTARPDGEKAVSG